MFKLLTPTLAILLFSSLIFAQPTVIWYGTFGENGLDVATHGQLTDDNGFIITGEYSQNNSTNYRNLYLIKAYSFGTMEWECSYGESFNSKGYCVKQTSDGGYIVAGYTNLENYQDSGDIFVIKVDASGDSIWSRVISSPNADCAYSLTQDEAGNYVIAGIIGGSMSIDEGNIYIIKIDPSGNTIWENEYDISGRDVGYCVETTPDGGFIISGAVNEDPREYFYTGEILLMKIDSNGSIEWQRNYGSGNGRSVICTQDGGYLISGEKASNISGYGELVHMIKTDSEGNVEWRDFWINDGSNSITNAIETFDGGYLLNGCGHLIKVDQNGVTQGVTPDVEDTNYNFLLTTEDNHYVAVGSMFFYNDLHSQVLLQKMDDQLGSLIVEIFPDTSTTQLPPSGGELMFDIEITNNHNEPQLFTISLNIQNSAGEAKYVGNRQFISILPGRSFLYEDYIQTIPASAPSGEYLFKAQVDDENTQHVIMFDTFEFEKLPGDQFENSNAGWKLDESEESLAFISWYPEGFGLLTANPNPFNPSTNISFNLLKDESVNLTIYDNRGREVARLVEGFKSAGSHVVRFDAVNFVSGVYFARLTGSGINQTQKLMLLK